MEGLSSDLSGQNGQLEASAAVLQQSLQHQAVYASSVSLTSPEQSEPDSDFATDGAGTEAGLSRPGSSDGDVSDDSTYGAVNRKRRKGQSGKPAKRVRSEVDNDQTRKLRSALPSEELSVPGLQVTNDFAHSNNQGSESAAAAELDEEDEEEEHTDSQSQPVERHLTAEQHADQLRQVQSMWQMAAVLEFLHTFSMYLQLRGSFTPEELEVALVSEVAQTGLLASLHQDLLKGITSRADLNSENWAAHFANRLKYQWTSTHLRGAPPFAPLKRHEAYDYAALHATDRVLALKLLCEIRLDKDDLRSAIELSMKPPKAPSRPPSGKTRAAGASTRGRPEPAPEAVIDVRHEPLGEDDQGVLYWYLDLGPTGLTGLTGVRLYKEIPAEAPPSPSPVKPSKGKEAAGTKGKGAKGRGKKAKNQGGLGGGLVPPPAEPSWELLGSSTDELQAVGEDLTGSRANAEADIGYQLLDEIVPTLVARAEALEKRAKAAAKIAAQLNNVVPDDNGHYGRSRRQRTQVNYNYDEYDRTIKDAIRGGRHEVFLPPARPHRDWSRPAPIESRRAGLRGGKPEEATNSSPDENRPSNDQSGAPESGTDRPDFDSNADSEHQAANGFAHSTWTDGSMNQPDMQNQPEPYDPYSVNQGRWDASTVAGHGHGYQRSFAVPSEHLSHVPHANGQSVTPSFFT